MPNNKQERAHLSATSCSFALAAASPLTGAALLSAASHPIPLAKPIPSRTAWMQRPDFAQAVLCFSVLHLARSSTQPISPRTALMWGAWAPSVLQLCTLTAASLCSLSLVSARSQFLHELGGCGGPDFTLCCALLLSATYCSLLLTASSSTDRVDVESLTTFCFTTVHTKLCFSVLSLPCFCSQPISPRTGWVWSA